MGYTTYEYYHTTYGGTLISSADFSKWNERASDKLDYLTCNNISKIGYANLEESAQLKVQKATCVLMDTMSSVESETKKYSDNEVVKSKSAGNEKIEYSTKDTVLSNSIGSVKAQNKLFFKMISEQLDGMELLYEGY